MEEDEGRHARQHLHSGASYAPVRRQLDPLPVGRTCISIPFPVQNSSSLPVLAAKSVLIIHHSIAGKFPFSLLWQPTAEIEARIADFF